MSKFGRKLIARIQAYHVVSGKRPAGVPKALFDRIIGGDARAALFVWLSVGALAAACLLMGLVAYSVFADRGMPRFRLIGAFLLQWASMLLIWLGKRRAVSSVEAELAASHGFMCLECGYSLIGSAESDVCPECNVPIDLWSIRTTWYEWFPETLDRCTAEARGDA